MTPPSSQSLQLTPLHHMQYEVITIHHCFVMGDVDVVKNYSDSSDNNTALSH
jgi:hypothetical protein